MIKTYLKIKAVAGYIRMSVIIRSVRFNSFIIIYLFQFLRGRD